MASPSASDGDARAWRSPARAGKGRKPTTAQVGRKPTTAQVGRKPTTAQVAWLRRGLAQPGGKLPLFDLTGQRISRATIRACLTAGWVEPWYHNPLKPDWDVCRLSDTGRRILAEMNVVRVDFSQTGSAGRRRRKDTSARAESAPGSARDQSATPAEEQAPLESRGQVVRLVRSAGGAGPLRVWAVE